MSAELKQHVTQSKQEDGVEIEREPDTLTENGVPEQPPTDLLVVSIDGYGRMTLSDGTVANVGDTVVSRDGGKTWDVYTAGGWIESGKSRRPGLELHSQLRYAEWEDDAATAPSEPTNWVERCERLQGELKAAKQREQKHLDMIERLVALGDCYIEENGGEHPDLEHPAPEVPAARAHLKENGRG